MQIMQCHSRRSRIGKLRPHGKYNCYGAEAPLSGAARPRGPRPVRAPGAEPAVADAATAVVGADLAAALTADLLTFNDAGLDSIGNERRARLVARYSGFAHPAAAEVVDWLNGGYAISGEAVQTQ